MAYAEKRDGKLTGRWFGDTRVEGKRYRREFERKKDAEAYEVFVNLMKMEPPGIGGGPASGRTFADVAAECKAAGGPRGAWKQERDDSVIPRLDYCLTVAVPVGGSNTGSVPLGAFDIEHIKAVQLEALAAHMEKRKVKDGYLSASTVNRYLHAVSAVLTFAVERDYIPRKPKLPLRKAVSKSRGILRSFDQEDAILSAMRAAGNELEAFCVQVLVTSGMRQGELYKLRPDQIENGYVHFEEDQTKNDEARTVWIGEEIADKLRALIAQNALPKEYRLLRTFKRAVKKCGYSGNLVIHSLRHTRNTRLRQQGVDIKIRMKMLGHKTVSTSMKYDHIDANDQLEAAKKVEAARGNPAENGQVVQFPLFKTAG